MQSIVRVKRIAAVGDRSAAEQRGRRFVAELIDQADAQTRLTGNNTATDGGVRRQSLAKLSGLTLTEREFDH